MEMEEKKQISFLDTRKKKILAIILLVIVVCAVILGALYYRGYFKKVPAEIILTDQEKIDILKSLNTEAEKNPLPEAEKLKILNNLIKNIPQE